MALKILGVENSNIHFLNFPDGELSNLAEKERQNAINQLVQILKTLILGEVYVTYRWDVHRDHEAAFALIRDAISSSKIQMQLFQYPIWSIWYPWRTRLNSQWLKGIYRLPISTVLDQKKQALQAYRSQYLPLADDIVPSTPLDFFKLFCKPYEIYITDHYKP